MDPSPATDSLALRLDAAPTARQPHDQGPSLIDSLILQLKTARAKAGQEAGGAVFKDQASIVRTLPCVAGPLLKITGHLQEGEILLSRNAT